MLVVLLCCWVACLKLVGGCGCAVSMEVAVEPGFMALGPFHVAVGMNNHCWFYSTDRSTPMYRFALSVVFCFVFMMIAGYRRLVAEREYLGSVRQICLNANYAAVLCEGRVRGVLL